MQSLRFVSFPLGSLVSFAAIVGCAALAGCGGSGGAGLFEPTAVDAGPQGSPMDGSIFPGDTGSILTEGGVTTPCPPAPVTSFAPQWKPPVASKSGACNSTQISSFFDACLGPSSDANGCAAFVQANTSCSACLQSDDTDAHYGPVIWHAKRTFYTTNIAGCIANEQADGGAAGCGAAYQAVVQCKETACSSCLGAQSSDFARYAACENKAGSECTSFLTTLTSTCGTALKDPTSPASVCIPPSGDTSQDAYLRLAPIFCGN